MNHHLPLPYWCYRLAFIKNYEEQLAKQTDPKAIAFLTMNLKGLLNETASINR